MTVSTANSKISYAGNGSTFTWTFSFPGVAASNILVFITNATGNITPLPASSYAVNLNAPVQPNPTSIGGTVTYPILGAPLAVGNTITIVRVLPNIQPTSIANQSIIYPPIIEQEFDYLTMIGQQTSEEIDRAVKVGIADTPMGPLPPLAFRINQPAVFDNNGNLTAGGIPGGGVIISPVMIPVVGAPTLAIARSTMGVPGIDSPVFTGDPQAPTPLVTDNDNSIATTAFVQSLGATLGVLIPSGTSMVFHQTTPPVGWTKDVDHNDKSLRVVNGTIGSGGVLGFSTVFNRTAVDGHTIDGNELTFHGHAVSDPTHSHPIYDPTHNHINADGGLTWACFTSVGGGWQGGANPYNNIAMGYSATGVLTYGVGTGIGIFGAGASFPHTHGMDNRVLYVDIIIATKD
jgi:hypothetical protein